MVMALSNVSSEFICMFSTTFSSVTSTTIRSRISWSRRFLNWQFSDSTWRAVIKLSALSSSSWNRLLNFARSYTTFLFVMKYFPKASVTSVHFFFEASVNFYVIKMSSASLPMEYNSVFTWTSSSTPTLIGNIGILKTVFPTVLAF